MGAKALKIVIDPSTKIEILIGRATSLAHIGETEKAIQAADELAHDPKVTADTLYSCACIYSAAGADNEARLRRSVDLLRNSLDEDFKVLTACWPKKTSPRFDLDPSLQSSYGLTPTESASNRMVGRVALARLGA